MINVFSQKEEVKHLWKRQKLIWLYFHNIKYKEACLFYLHCIHFFCHSCLYHKGFLFIETQWKIFDGFSPSLCPILYGNPRFEIAFAMNRGRGNHRIYSRLVSYKDTAFFFFIWSHLYFYQFPWQLLAFFFFLPFFDEIKKMEQRNVCIQKDENNLWPSIELLFKCGHVKVVYEQIY